MSQVEVDQPTQNEELRLRTPVQQNSDEVESLTEDLGVVREEAQSFTSQPISKSSNKAFPIFMIVISLIQVYTFCKGGIFSRPYMGYDPSRRHEVWRFLTPMFVHDSVSHLLANLTEQLIFGVLLEIVHHWKPVAIIYTTGVLGGTLFVNFLTPYEYGAGASAGVHALIFAQVANIVLNWKGLDNKWTRLFLLIVAYYVYEVGPALYSQLVVENHSEISHVGHFGGALTGFLISILVLKNLEERPWEKTLQKICAAILIILTIIIVIINVACPSLYPPSEFNTDYKETILLRQFKLIDTSSKPSEHLFLMNCLKFKKCADAWAEYKNTGKVTDAHFVHVT